MQEAVDAKLIKDLLDKFNYKFQSLNPSSRVGQCTLTAITELQLVYASRVQKQYSEAEIKSWNGMSQ